MRLGVNIDHVATVRQVRRGAEPDVIEAARACERAGADSIVCHLREDRRHIQDRDVARLRKELSVPLNLEMSVSPGIVEVALKVKPQQVTLVPERRQELTTEGGLDVVRLASRLLPVIDRFQDRGIAVSLFVDPTAAQVEAAEATGAKLIELHTGAYATARTASARQRWLEALRKAAHQARQVGLDVAAGHGLDYDNVQDVSAIHDIEELNIGFSIISRSLFIGLSESVREMKARLAH